ncbi:pyruvate, phosphate dikinase, partial [bacterium]|nr:pyruvate, phosphate dikinase [bacterium]
VYYFKNNNSYPHGLESEIETNLKKLEGIIGKKMGDPNNPLLVSVRSGARTSMPGMMDTVLNLGLNDETAKGLSTLTKNERFVYDSYRRLLTMFGDVVLGITRHHFESLLEKRKEKQGVKLDFELSSENLKQLCKEYKELIKREKGFDFPQEPRKQLKMAIDAVFDSWNNQRAVTYRKINKIPDDWGTAVNIQTMVFGNLGDDCATGVAFTRDPANGENIFFGEYLSNAQGEDVVAGIRTPKKISELQQNMPEIYKQLVDIYKKLEQRYKDMQDIEFTIQNSKLYMLQTRNGKRTAISAVRIAVEMVDEKLIDIDTALTRIDPAQLDQLLHPMFDPKVKVQSVAKGLPGSSGAAVGKVVFTAERAIELVGKGEKVVLVRNETSPEDVGGMHVSEGILTARGGLTSHAAVVGRGMGKCCVVGCGAIKVNDEEGYFTIGDKTVKEGDFISLNGNTGEVILGKVNLIEPEFNVYLEKILTWADERRKLGVRANADTPEDAANAIKYGAMGIGLCRTEHMFFGEERIPIVRQMIMASNTETRNVYIMKLLPFQREDFIGIFKAMKGYPVTIRLLDPPLHEFLPNRLELQERLLTLEFEKGSKDEINKIEKLIEIVKGLEEFNPMLGHRGCRLGVTFPEIYNMQVQAIMEAAVEVVKSGGKVSPEIMIPLTGTIGEMKITHDNAKNIADEVLKKSNMTIPFMIGTMIEIPRASIIADQIAQEAEFFSFGTNDLTQMTFGYSRDDAGKFLPKYVDMKILKEDPFVSIDQEGVGELIKMGIERGRSARANLKVGICGEHGGEPASVKFCHRVGMNYVSCSPFRLPIARLAAAQAAIEEKFGKARHFDE